MAPQHLAYSDQGLESYLVWAKRFGPATQAVVRAQYEGKRSNSFIANQACSALRLLAHQYEPSEFEAACKRAQAIASMRLSSVKSILRTGLYKQGADFKPVQPQLPLHENIRGASYYAQGGAMRWSSSRM